MARIVDTLYDTTSATAGTLTATLATTNYNRLLLVAQTAGSGGASSYTVSDYSTGTALTLLTLTAIPSTLNAGRADGVGPGTTAAGATSTWPVSITTRITITAGASTTVRLIVYGVIEASV